MPAHPLRATLAGVFLFVIGLAIAGGTYQVARQEQERLREWLRADGTVVDLITRRSPAGEMTAPVVAFSTSSGERIRFTAPGRSSPARINDHVPVIYHPDHPQDALIDPRERRWIRNALGGGGALLLLGLGGCVAWYASRLNATAP